MADEPYRIEVTATARRTLDRLPDKVVGACLEFIAGPLASEPRRLGKPLQRELSGYHSARRGSYRVVYRIDESARTVIILRVDSRADVYRSR